jgi:ankyrin repeat protein
VHNVLYVQSLRTIIEQGLDPNMNLWVGCHKTTILSLACEYGQEKIVNAIISEQSELRIDCQDEVGKTPLMVAAKKGLTSIVDVLIERCVCIIILW